MPAFGAYTGSLNVLDRAYAGLFKRDGLMAYMIGADPGLPDRRIDAAAGLDLDPPPPQSLRKTTLPTQPVSIASSTANTP